MSDMFPLDRQRRREGLWLIVKLLAVLALIIFCAWGRCTGGPSGRGLGDSADYDR